MLEKDSGKPQVSPPLKESDVDRFPETQTRILAGAAAGDWNPFLRSYLRPCWREVVVACRARGVTLDDADDLFQELMLRVMSDGQFGSRLKELLAQSRQDPNFQGNLPARYLKSRELPDAAARFRTYLKAVIRNLLIESLRGKHNAPQSLDTIDVIPAVEQSLSLSIDRQWVVGCLDEAAARLHAKSAAARGQGQRRGFAILAMSIADGATQAAIARHFGIDRSTATTLLKQARRDFLEILQDVTGIAELNELRKIISRTPESLGIAFQRVRASFPLQT